MSVCAVAQGSMEIEDGGMAEEAADWFSRSFQLQIFGKKIDATGAKRLLGLAYVSLPLNAAECSVATDIPLRAAACWSSFWW